MKGSSSAFRWLGPLRDFILGGMGIFCLAVAIFFTYSDRLQSAALLFTAGFFLCVFSSLSRFESIKGLGVEAKMVALNSKLSEADELLKYMRHMVGLMADTSFQIIGNLGRWDAEIPKPELLKIVRGFSELLVTLGEPTTQIERRLHPWHLNNKRDLARPILVALHEFAQFQNQLLTEQARRPTGEAVLAPSEVSRRFDENSLFVRRLNDLSNVDISKFPNAAEELIDSAENAPRGDLAWLSKKLKEPLDEMRYYLEHQNFIDETLWLSRPYHWRIPLDFTELRFMRDPH